VVGLLGWPVDHSLSPRIHGYWMEKCGIDAAYVPLPVVPDRFAQAVRGLAACGFRGANVTIPHKVAALPLCNRLSAPAEMAGAVNTLVFEPDGSVTGMNTDGAGFVASLTAAGVDVAGQDVLVLGAGGAARALAAALRGLGCAVTIASRRPEQAAALAETLAATGTPPLVAPWPGSTALGGSGLLINATAGGMHGKPALEVDLQAAPQDLVVADIVYAPRETPLLRAARSRGLETVGGLEMLLHQAALSFESWFGHLPPIDAPLRARVAA
jgi:shikimate dehydrogenase